jgi:enterochelin esterase-like enzyme
MRSDSRRPFAGLTVALAACAAVASLTLLDAQRRGGPPPAGGRGGGPAGAPRASKVETITVHGKALEGNLEGDSPDRTVTVYLPPTYGADQNRRFPVVYLLHGFGVGESGFIEQVARLKESADRLSSAQGFSEFIVVTPNAETLHGNSLYSSSPTTGDWEKFVADDLVGYIDAHYRTLPARLSRGLAGHSAGGYGALRIGMKRADVFSSLYVMSACCTVPVTPMTLLPFAAPIEAITTREQAEAASHQPAIEPTAALASSAAWAPNPSATPFFLDSPVKGGAVRQEVLAKWNANAVVTMLDRYGSNLQRYYAIAIDIGTKDPLLAGSRQLHDALARLHVPHLYEEYDGNHTDRIRDRVDRNLLPFFSKNLVAPANPTSPQIKD